MKLAFVTILMTLVSGQTFAHGMNKLGPNSGYVRMPGSYHVELVPGATETKVYFLDMAFKKISIDKARASLKLTGSKNQSVSCTREAEFFKCAVTEEAFKNYKELEIESSRSGERGAKSVYKLPLSL